ncbi:MAG: hypothetical protein Q9170_003844 [Blastenia crenularia]
MDKKATMYSGVRKNENSHAYETAPIAAIFEDCLQFFERLCTITEIDEEAEQAGFPMIESSYDRFRQWGNETGAPNRSLDHALRKSSHLQQATKDLLTDLLSALMTSLSNPKSQAEHTLEELVQEGLQDAAIPHINSPADYFGFGSESGPTGSNSPSRASSESDTSFQQLTSDVEECVNCLTRLVPSLRDPAPQDTYKENMSYNEAQGDIEVAKRMFPRATSSLIRRLGFASWKRRQALLDLKLRDQKPKGDNRLHPGPRPPGLLNIMNPSDWDPAFSPQSLGSSSDSTYTGVPSVIDSIFSQSDYFSSRSGTSVAGSEQFTWVKHFDIPKPPIVLKPGCSFDCPYCGQEIIVGLQVDTSEDWSSHVLLDLEPYMCTFEDCLRADKLFGNRESWFQHELDSHRLRRIWSCQSCSHNFDELEDIELHLSEKHKNSNDPSQMSLMLSLCERFSSEGISAQPCPMCGCTRATTKALEEHIAGHLEQLALSSVSNVYGPDVVTQSHDGTSIEKKAKMEDLNKFVDEQRGYFWKPSQLERDDSASGSNVAFAEDSDDEAVHQDVHFSPALPTLMKKSGRPQMQRRGDSWMKRVNDFFDNQPADQQGKAPWLSRVQTFLETPSAEGGPYEERKIDSPAGSPIQSPLRPSAQEPTVYVPPHCLRTNQPPRNKDFIGRDSDLMKLHENLSLQGTSCIVTGAGGMGKTETAIEYTYRYNDAYSYIFWVSAETAISCADTYSLIATEFIVTADDVMYEQGRLVTLGRDFLEQTDLRWLLVFDNVTSWSDIQPYIPTRSHETSGSILITSRNQKLVGSMTIPDCQHLELTALPSEESRLFLLNAMQASVESKDMTSHPEYKLAGVIAKEAEGLPLALTQIAGYIQVSKCTLTDFVQLWNERRRHTKSSNPLANPSLLSTDKALETVWAIGLRDCTIDARELLNILAFLDSDCIQRKLLVGEHEEPSLDFLHSDQAFRYKRMITELSRRNIIAIKTQKEEGTLSIHKSLQRKILQDLEKDPRKRDEVFSQAFDLVRKQFPLPSPIQVPEPAKWPACKEFLPHVLHLENVIMNIVPSINPSIKMARLMSDGGINLWERGMTGEGLRLLKSAETVLDKLEVQDTQLRANINVVINLLIQDYGLTHIAESEQRSRKALDIRLEYREQTGIEDYTRNDDILLHNAWSDYGCVLLQYNKFEEAEPIFHQCHAKYLLWGSESEIPYEYYKYNHHASFCRLYRHDFARAIQLAEASLRLITLATGQSSAANKTKFDLACIVLQSGDTQRALALHKEALEANMRLHGKFNFLTLQSYYAVGAVSAYSGNLTEAERWMRKALTLEESRKGSWPEAANARAQFHLSQILKEQGKEADEAQQLATQAESVLGRLLPSSPLEGVVPGDELALFDHLQPVFDGRFAGRTLLKYVSRKDQKK